MFANTLSYLTPEQEERKRDKIFNGFSFSITKEKIKELFEEVHKYKMHTIIPRKFYERTITKEIYDRITEKRFLEEVDGFYRCGFEYILNAIFQRFKIEKCVIEAKMADDEVRPKANSFFLNDIVGTNQIKIYDFFLVFIFFSKLDSYDKIKFLFNIADKDDDGLISLEEFKKLIIKCSLIFTKEEYSKESILIGQSLGLIKSKSRIKSLLYRTSNSNISRK
ncbi:MAG: hypothetical protein MJ252_07780 [archaeon]|nr:hypothetical protein [archaeon]